MKKEKTLQELQTDITDIQEEKEKYEKELRQLYNREKILEKQEKIKEQKRRNHRLIVRGAILEKFIEGAEEKSTEEIKVILEKVFGKKYDELLSEEKSNQKNETD